MPTQTISTEVVNLSVQANTNLAVTTLGSILGNNASALTYSGTRLSVSNFGTIASNFGSGIIGSGTQAIIHNAGTIFGSGSAIFLSSDNLSAEAAVIVNTGMISSYLNSAILIDSGLNTIVNRGSVTNTDGNCITINNFSGSIGIDHFNRITNTGEIVTLAQPGAAFAIETSSDSDYVMNSGLIHGRIDLSGGNNSFFNSGTLESDQVNFGAGNDRMTNRGTIDGVVLLGDGSNTFDGRGGHVSGYVQGGAGSDLFYVDQSDIVLIEGVGAEDTVDTVKSSVSFVLPENFEYLYLTSSGAIDGTGNSTRNVIYGGAGSNEIAGGGGNDVLLGRGGQDRLLGEADDDLLIGGTGDDTAFGGAGNDTLQGQDGYDSLIGGAGNDSMSGDADADTLAGGAGRDTLQGGDDDDVLIGGATGDALSGGAGADRFVYLNAADSTTASSDRITDFTHALDLFDFTALVQGSIAYRGTGAFVAGGAQVRFIPGAVTEVLVDLNGDNFTDLRITLTGNIPLDINDFLL